MNSKEALQIAAIFRKRRGHLTDIGPYTPALWYDSFEFVDGPAWIIEAALPPSNFEGSDTITYVVSVKEKCVKYIINSSGFPKFPDGPDYAFTPDELEELKEMGFKIID